MESPSKCLEMLKHKPAPMVFSMWSYTKDLAGCVVVICHIGWVQRENAHLPRLEKALEEFNN
jgi:hypothetical protein